MLGITEYSNPVADPGILNLNISDANNNDADELCNLGSAYIEFGQIPMAISALQQATKLKPEYANAWHNLGNAYFQDTQRDKAASAYRQTLSLDPDHISAKHNLQLSTMTDL